MLVSPLMIRVKGYSLIFQKEENIEAIKKDEAIPPEENISMLTWLYWD